MQDRILGPLTMIQLLYAVIGGGAGYSIYMSVPSPWGGIFAFPVLLFTVALIFVKVNERPFLNFFLSMLEFMSNPKRRIWHHQSNDNMQVIIYKPKQHHKQVQTKNIPPERIHELAEKLDQS